MCPKHGTDFLEYKCRYCCSVAVFFCFGTTHFCNSCHDDFQRVTNIPKGELPNCPAGKFVQCGTRTFVPKYLRIFFLFCFKLKFCFRTESKAIGWRRVSAARQSSTNRGRICFGMRGLSQRSYILVLIFFLFLVFFYLCFFKIVTVFLSEIFFDSIKLLFFNSLLNRSGNLIFINLHQFKIEDNKKKCEVKRIKD